MNMQQKLSDNFKVYELVRSSTAARNDIDQLEYLNETVIANAEAVAENVAEKIRRRFGAFTPSSWFRSEPLERILCWNSFANSWCTKRGLAPNEENWKMYFARKQHPKGMSMDIEIVGISNDYLFDWCKEHLEFDQLIREFPKKGDPMSGWVHISYNPNGNRNQAFTIG